jgi:hypothetical protein
MLFADNDDGMTFKNLFYSIWLSYATKAIEMVDLAVICHKEQIDGHHHQHHNKDDIQPIVNNDHEIEIKIKQPHIKMNSVTDNLLNEEQYINDDAIRINEIELVNQKEG